MIVPPQMHLHVDDLSSAGCPFSSTSFFPPVHGNGVLGMQGIGVSLPCAAAVAETVAGYARLRQRPNGAIFFIGVWSLILACGRPDRYIVLFGETVSVEILFPHEHSILALEQTYESSIAILIGIVSLF